ncbi:MAG: MATE family efflux transporter [Clostridia bacterium]|nr:MATE family efflux transporter [Clostridia bacterium]
MNNNSDFTQGSILSKLLRFMLPVLLALFLQAMYGAVDLLVVGQFATSVDVSAVSTGSQIMMTITNIVASFAMGATVLIGRKIGEGRADEAGQVIGSSILLFGVIGLVFSFLTVLGAPGLAGIMHAPAEAMTDTVQYVRICGAGMLIIVAYNLIGCVFRGIGDSNTPLISVAIACVTNIAGDLLLVAVLKMGTRGAAIATVFAQLVSVVLSVLLIRRKTLPFTFSRSDIRWRTGLISQVTILGLPIAVQDFLVGISFLVILAIVNSLGLVASAGIGVAEKVCGFIMLVPSAFMQSMSAFVAQNIGAAKPDRARQALKVGIIASECFGVVMFLFAFFRGTILTGIFSNDPEVVLASAEYLKAYAIDCMFTAFLFCFIGYFNGLGQTSFVMAQGIIGAFAIRIPVSFLMSRMVPVSLFHIGLAIPCSTVIQISCCFLYLFYMRRKGRL